MFYSKCLNQFMMPPLLFFLQNIASRVRPGGRRVLFLEKGNQKESEEDILDEKQIGSADDAEQKMLNISDEVPHEEPHEEPPENSSDKEEKKPEEPKKHFSVTTILIAILTLMVLIMGYFIYTTNIRKDDGVEDASVVMAERNTPETKAKQLDPTKVYRLHSATDSYNGFSMAVTRVQFRQDTTRLWVKVDNDSGKEISLMSANARLTDNNGHAYKVDSFGGDQLSSIAPGTHEEVLLAFTPVRADAKTLTFTMDSVFDMKHTAWNYSVQFDVP